MQVLFKQLFPLVMIRPDVGVSNDGFDNREHDYILCVNDILTSPNDDQYLVIDMLGTGTFGQVRSDFLSWVVKTIEPLRSITGYARTK